MLIPNSATNDRRAFEQMRLAEDALDAIVTCPACNSDEVRIRMYLVAALLANEGAAKPFEFEKKVVNAIDTIARDLATIEER